MVLEVQGNVTSILLTSNWGHSCCIMTWHRVLNGRHHKQVREKVFVQQGLFCVMLLVHSSSTCCEGLCWRRAMFFTLSLNKWNIRQEKIPVSLLHSLLIMVHKFNPHHSCYILQFKEMINQGQWTSLMIECTLNICEDWDLITMYEKQQEQEKQHTRKS